MTFRANMHGNAATPNGRMLPTGLINQLQLWRMQVIAEAGVQDPRKPIPSEGKFESLALEWLEQNLPRYKRSFRRTVAMFAYRYLIPRLGQCRLRKSLGRWLTSGSARFAFKTVVPPHVKRCRIWSRRFKSLAASDSR